MDDAKQKGNGVLTGSAITTAVGGSGNPDSPSEPNPRSNGLQNNPELASLVEVAKQQAQQIQQLIAMNSESQKIIGKLGNEVGQLRKQQPAITPELKRQFKNMIDDEETTLDAVQLVARNTIGSVVSQDNAVMDAFFQARQIDTTFASIPFDEYKWQALKSGVPLENLSDPDNAKVFLRQIVSSKPVDIEAIKAAARAEGAKTRETEITQLLKEKGIAGLVLPSSNGNNYQHQQLIVEPLNDEEENEKIAIVLAIRQGQIAKERIPQDKRLRYGIS